MNKLFLVTVSVLAGTFLALGLWKAGIWHHPASNLVDAPQIAVASVSPSPQSTPVATPKLLSIPSLNINTSIEQVGLDSQKRMDVPKNDVDVAWYDLGYKIGQKGNAVIDGHLDTVTGAPAVFYYLSNIKRGDKIIVTDTNGSSYTFVVTDKKYFDFDKVPLSQVFGPSSTSNLNLITCEGIWNSVTKNYSQRIVIYSSLQQNSG